MNFPHPTRRPITVPRRAATPAPRRGRGKTLAALVTAALLVCVPFLLKRGCHFRADFDPVKARTNSVTATSRPSAR